MVIGFAFFIVALLIIGVYLIIELKRAKHKLFAIFLIVLILFFYISANLVFKDKDIAWKSPSGIMKGANLYLSWLGSAFGNVKSLTSYAVKMDWESNKTLDDTKESDKKGIFKFSSVD